MQQVQLELTDQIYDQAKRRAVEAGFKTVGEYIADVVSDDLAKDSENLDHLFTPRRIAHLDKVAAEVRAGGATYTMEEVSAHLDEKRADWIRKNCK
jgi:hypothetical protein